MYIRKRESKAKTSFYLYGNQKFKILLVFAPDLILFLKASVLVKTSFFKENFMEFNFLVFTPNVNRRDESLFFLCFFSTYYKRSVLGGYDYELFIK